MSESRTRKTSYGLSLRCSMAAPTAPPRLEKITKMKNIATKPITITAARPSGLFMYCSTCCAWGSEKVGQGHAAPIEEHGEKPGGQHSQAERGSQGNDHEDGGYESSLKGGSQSQRPVHLRRVNRLPVGSGFGERGLRSGRSLCHDGRSGHPNLGSAAFGAERNPVFDRRAALIARMLHRVSRYRSAGR
jgi:hypothetical protein